MLSTTYNENLQANINQYNGTLVWNGKANVRDVIDWIKDEREWN